MRITKFNSIILFCLLPFLHVSAKPGKGHPFRKAARAQPSGQSISSGIYKPGKALNYLWNSFDWFFTGTSVMTYTPFGKLASKTDSSFSVARSLYTYDDQQRETEKLDQQYNPVSLSWDNWQRTVTVYDAMGEQQEYRNESWNGLAWSITWGNKDLITYNGQNHPTLRLQKNWSQADNAWVNEYKDSSFVYDAQNRLQSFVSSKWDTNQWLNEEKTLWQYGADNKPNQVIIQEWNGSAFVDSTRIVDIIWDFWNGNFYQCMPSRFTMQKLVNGNWVNFQRNTTTMGANGSEESLYEIYIGGTWVPQSKNSYLIDDQQNPVHSLYLTYNPGSAAFDTTYITYYENSYDGQGRILSQVMYGWDQDLHQLRKMSKAEFSAHSVFTAALSNRIENEPFAFPNPVQAGQGLNLEGASGNFRLLDRQGKLVRSGSIAAEKTLDTGNLLPGLHLLQVQRRDGTVASLKIAVN